MDCLCGKPMLLMGETVPRDKLIGKITIWACPPTGCGRIFLAGSGDEIAGTYYLPEQNEQRERL